MKKLLSIVLAVAVMATMAFSMMGVSASAETISLLPSSADKFVTTAGGDYDIASVTATGNGGYSFKSEGGWPNAVFASTEAGVDPWVTVNVNDDLYLNYDFEVVSGATNVIIYFCGQNPKDQASLGSFLCLNGVVDPSYVNPLTGDAVTDLPVGKYAGKIKVSDLGCREDLMVDGDFIISGVKVFAVGGETIVNDLSIGGADSSSADVVTTGTQSAATTTAAKTSTTAGQDSAKTGDVSNAMMFIIVAAAAVAVVTVSAVASKKAKSR